MAAYGPDAAGIGFHLLSCKKREATVLLYIGLRAKDTRGMKLSTKAAERVVLPIFRDMRIRFSSIDDYREVL